ncbi:MAG: hypothetical protein GVY08_11035 [Bacteroidetes bacterium]|jgi:hypothetical protein|nr:hypothetical protein [Bacteroidota bacterium]
MWIYVLFLIALFVIGVFTGRRPQISLHKLTPQLVLNTALVVLVAFTSMMIAFIVGILPQYVAAPLMACTYCFIGGFFSGYAFRLYRARTSGGTILYQNRSFWVDHAPALFAAGLIIYGIYRTSILTTPPVTGIRVTSGLSLICFGIFTWTLKVVPEFRSKGILFLDRFISWKKILSWSWHSEDVIKIEYMTTETQGKDRIKQFVTSIPPEEKKQIEMILNSKMDEYADQRSKELMGDD